MSVDASYGNQGDSSAISFPTFAVENETRYLQFNYHMFGEDVGQLLLQVVFFFWHTGIPNYFSYLLAHLN